jgi:hypothetical protein
MPSFVGQTEYFFISISHCHEGMSHRVGKHMNRDLPFNSKLLASRTTLLPLVDSSDAISRAASSFRSCRKPLLDRTASPINSADRASPWARTMIDC